MTTQSILLTSSGNFNIIDVPNVYLSKNSFEIRYNKNVIDYFKYYGNTMARNCTLYLDNIPTNIFLNKKMIINKDVYGKETLYFFDNDGDVFMRNF